MPPQKKEAILFNKMFSGKKFYLTKKGLEEVKKEHKELLEIRKCKTKGEMPEILHSEDINPEYLSYMEDIELLDEKISELENVLKNTEIISPPKKEKRKEVGFGAKVHLEVDGSKDQFEIVGTIEANPSLGRISNESPVGKALIGLKEGETIVISSPVKTLYKIKKIEYP